MQTKELIAALRKFVKVRSKMSGMTDNIHGLEMGFDDEIVLTQTMLSQAADALEATLWRDDVENAPSNSDYKMAGYVYHSPMNGSWYVLLGLPDDGYPARLWMPLTPPEAE